MAKNVHLVPEETIKDVCRKIESGKIDLKPKTTKEEIEKMDISLEIIK